MSSIESDVRALYDITGASSDAHLAELLGYSRAAVAHWKRRGSVPRKAKARAEALKAGNLQSRAMDQRRIQLGHQIMYEGLCLALFLAPARETSGSRFSAVAFGGVLRNYASLFREIELACAEEVAARLADMSGANAADAMAALTGDNPEALYDRVMKRAYTWREGSE